MGTKEELEMNRNLDKVDDSLRTLKEMACAMGTELDVQNERLDRVGLKQQQVADDLAETTREMNRKLKIYSSPTPGEEVSKKAARFVVNKVLE